MEGVADSSDVQSPETYIGYHRAENFASPGGFNQNEAQLYNAPEKLKVNEWALAGKWEDERQIPTSSRPQARSCTASTPAIFTWFSGRRRRGSQFVSA